MSYPPGVTQWHIDYYAGGYDEPKDLMFGEWCEGGVILRAEPQRDDPYFTREIGRCPSWPGCGCEWDLPAPEGGCETQTMDDLEEERDEEAATSPNRDAADDPRRA